MTRLRAVNPGCTRCEKLSLAAVLFPCWLCVLCWFAVPAPKVADKSVRQRHRRMLRRRRLLWCERDERHPDHESQCPCCGSPRRDHERPSPSRRFVLDARLVDIFSAVGFVVALRPRKVVPVIGGCGHRRRNERVTVVGGHAASPKWLYRWIFDILGAYTHARKRVRSSG
jgi:hypothetical protein